MNRENDFDVLDRAVVSARKVSLAAPFDARASRDRVLAATVVRERSYRALLAAAAVVCALFVAPAAWAFASGALGRWVRQYRGRTPAAATMRAGHGVLSTHARNTVAQAAVQVPAMVAQAVLEPPSVVRSEPSVVAPPSLALQTIAHGAPGVPQRDVVHSEQTHGGDIRHVAAATPAPNELYAIAHRIHFVDHNPEAALRAWDEYLRAEPSGVFAPEARYNRAIDLIRLHRIGEAVQALRPIADGVLNGYRQQDAQRLIDAYTTQSGSTEIAAPIR